MMNVDDEISDDERASEGRLKNASKKAVHSMSFSPEFVERVDKYAARFGASRSAQIMRMAEFGMSIQDALKDDVKEQLWQEMLGTHEGLLETLIGLIKDGLRARQQRRELDRKKGRPESETSNKNESSEH